MMSVSSKSSKIKLDAVYTGVKREMRMKENGFGIRYG